MNIDNLNTVIAIISAILGGGAVKMLEVFITARRGTQDYATVIRDELRKNASELRMDIASLEERLEGVEKDRDSWRERYYGEREKHINDGSAGEGC